MDSTQHQVSRAFQRRYEDGEIVFEEGDEGTDLFLIQSGNIQITRRGPGGPLLLAKLTAGDFFGEMSVVLGEDRTGRATAIGPTHLLVLDGETLESMCVERPEIAIRMMQRMALRLIEAERRLAALGLDDVVGPLIHFIGAQAGPHLNEELRFSTSLRELASKCEMSMAATHDALHQLLDEKLVRLEGDDLIAPNPGALVAARARFDGTTFAPFLAGSDTVR